MATLKDYRNERLRKLEELGDLGFKPFPSKVVRTHRLGEITSGFDKLDGQSATVAGRITGIRKFGKLAFIVIKDETASLQLFLQGGRGLARNAKENLLGMEDLNLLDTGDFVEASGKIIKTKTGEISIDTEKLKIIAKSLRPMASAVDGFSNKEERMRRRYVDMNVNEDVKKRFERRSVFWQATRDFLNQNGFFEINTPVLEHTTGGADATPFSTHMDALGEDFYLRISQELPLKKLIGGGFEKVYDIGPRFRNENYSEEHLPEHIAMEWYWAYANYQDGMKFMEDMYRDVLKKTFGTLQFKLHGFDIDLEKDWQTLDYAKALKDKYDIDVFDSPIEDIQAKLREHKLEVEQTDNRARGIDKLWKNIRKDLAGPLWLINTPKFISPLAKTSESDDRVVERFQAVIAGSELGNGYSELNDPIDQLNRFIEQDKMREAGDSEAMMLDIDYVEMLEYGMPPTCGWGYSERVFWVFEGVSAREGVPFPQLRSEIDSTTKELYPEVNL